MSEELHEAGTGPSGAGALLWVMLGLVALASVIAVKVGVDELRLIASGQRRALSASEVTASTQGWVEVSGCIRHDLAVRVTPSGSAFLLGGPGPASSFDLVFTPLVADDECDEERPPSRVAALIEDEDAVDNTLGHTFGTRVAPPPVRGFVEGVIGFGTGSPLRALRARALGPALGGIEQAPLIAKGRRPGVAWASAVTVAAGLHGLALVVIAVRWARRRARRVRALHRGETSDAEEDFFRSETLD